MKIAYFTHSLLSCWNHGNAHFLRGVLSELRRRGHEAVALEARDNWSLTNLIADHGMAGLDAMTAAYPELKTRSYTAGNDTEELVDGADVVIVHEWNDPALVARIGSLRKKHGHFTLLFHDTHHRAVSDPQAIRAFDLSGYDGILAFGQTLSDVYRRWGWEGRVWTWHEAADLHIFRPPTAPGDRQGLVWIGNWGDGERTAELESFLFRPAGNAGLRLDLYGVRYPEQAMAMLQRYGVHYHGWLANAAVPRAFGRALATVHVPRRYYASLLPGIPTIRMFEALACGIPLVSAPWTDSEGLFRAGEDYLVARDEEEMVRHLHAIADDPGLRESLAGHGLETIRARHSCAHRVDELLRIVGRVVAPHPARNVA